MSGGPGIDSANAPEAVLFSKQFPCWLVHSRFAYKAGIFDEQKTFYSNKLARGEDRPKPARKTTKKDRSKRLKFSKKPGC